MPNVCTTCIFNYCAALCLHQLTVTVTSSFDTLDSWSLVVHEPPSSENTDGELQSGSVGTSSYSACEFPSNDRNTRHIPVLCHPADEPVRGWCGAHLAAGQEQTKSSKTVTIKYQCGYLDISRKRLYAHCRMKNRPTSY